MKKLSKKDKVLYTIVKMHSSGEKSARIEDILVRSFEFFPQDFQINFYPQYPDTECIRRVLYALIPEGYVRIANRYCSLTKEGSARGEEINSFLNGDNTLISGRKDSYYNSEIKRLTSLEGFIMFLNNKTEKVIDKDFYDFYKASVRTKPLELAGKMKQINEAVKKFSGEGTPLSSGLWAYSSFLQNKFKENYIREKE